MQKYNNSVTNCRLLTEEAIEEAVRNCELVKRRDQEEEDTVTLEEIQKQRVEALNLVEKERKVVEQERAVYESIADKISKRLMYVTSYWLTNALTQRI